jgi:hypothetical protein
MRSDKGCVHVMFPNAETDASTVNTEINVTKIDSLRENALLSGHKQ